MLVELHQTICQTRLSVRVMLVMLLLATIAFAGMAMVAWPEFTGTITGCPSQARDLAFLGGLFSACGLVGWIYAADLDITLRSRDRR